MVLVGCKQTALVVLLPFAYCRTRGIEKLTYIGATAGSKLRVKRQGSTPTSYPTTDNNGTYTKAYLLRLHWLWNGMSPPAQHKRQGAQGG